MKPRWAVLLLAAMMPLWWLQGQERKPSPFPEKNRKRETAAKGSADSPGTKGQTTPQPQAGGADRSAAPPNEGTATGIACFLTVKSDRARAAGAPNAQADEVIAAHPTYPIGSRVRVTNLKNGRTIEVKITDRLPDAGRIISVSDTAAKRLGFYSEGVANVKVELLPNPEARP